MKAFETFTQGGVKYLAFPINGNDTMIIDEDGNSYGAWQDINNFKRLNKSDSHRQPIGKARIAHVVDRTAPQD